MKNVQNPGACEATGAQGEKLEKLESTYTLPRCARCGQRISAHASIISGLGRDCRRLRARSTSIADRLVDLAGGLDRLPLIKLALLSAALDDVLDAF